MEVARISSENSLNIHNCDGARSKDVKMKKIPSVDNANISRLRSHLVPKHGAQVQFSLGTNVNSYFPSTHPRIWAHCIARVQLL